MIKTPDEKLKDYVSSSLNALGITRTQFCELHLHEIGYSTIGSAVQYLVRLSKGYPYGTTGTPRDRELTVHRLSTLLAILSEYNQNESLIEILRQEEPL